MINTNKLKSITVNNKKIVECFPMENYAAFLIMYDDLTTDRLSYSQAFSLVGSIPLTVEEAEKVALSFLRKNKDKKSAYRLSKEFVEAKTLLGKEKINELIDLVNKQ